MSVLKIIGLMFLGWFTLDLLLGLVLMGLASRKVKREAKLVIPQKADPGKLCRGPHSWLLASTLTKDGPGQVQVCRVCGFISGSDKCASPESIDRIEENIRVREIEGRLVKDFLSKEDDDIKNYFDAEIKGGLDFEKLVHIHTAGMTFNQRFTFYKSSRAEEIKKELTRNDS